MDANAYICLCMHPYLYSYIHILIYTHTYTCTVKVCRRVTRDHAVDERTRLIRTKALLILGEEFMRYGVPSEKGISELLSKMTSAMAGKTPGETGEEEDETDEQKSLNKDKAPDTVEKAMTMSVKELKAAVRYALIHVFIASSLRTIFYCT